MTPQELFQKYKGKKANGVFINRIINRGIIVGYSLNNPSWKLIMTVDYNFHHISWGFEGLKEDDFVSGERDDYHNGFWYVNETDIVKFKFGRIGGIVL